MNSVSFDAYSDFQGHLWNDQMPDFVRARKNDIAVVAGDLHRDPEVMALYVRKMREAYPIVNSTGGNAEDGGPVLAGIVSSFTESRELTSGIMKKLNDDIGGVHYLPDGPCIINGVAFVGRPVLYDHKCCAEITQEGAIGEQAKLLFNIFDKNANDAEAKSQMEKQGALQVSTKRLSMEEADALARESVRLAIKDVRDMQGEIDALDKDPSVHTVIAVPHTVPHPALIKEREGDSAWRKSTAANTEIYGLKGEKLKYVVYGHQIDNDGEKIKLIDGKTYVANPMGGPRDALYHSPAEYGPLSVDIPAPAGPSITVKPDPAPAL